MNQLIKSEDELVLKWLKWKKIQPYGANNKLNELQIVKELKKLVVDWYNIKF